MGDRRTQSQQSFDSFIINTGGSSSRSGGRSSGGSSRGGSSYSSDRSSGGDRGGYSSDRGGDRGGRSFGGGDRGGRSFGGDRGGRSFGGGGSRFGGGRGGNRGGGRRSDINENLYVRKATDVVIKEYEPKHTFNDFDIHPALKERIERRGYKIPTAIQDQAIPLVLQGKDVIGLANTGTGKTASFLIPVIDKILKSRNNENGLPERELIKPGAAGSTQVIANSKFAKTEGDRPARGGRDGAKRWERPDRGDRPEFKYFIENEPKCLVVVPTRELATQIEDELMAFAPDLRIFSAVCVGGTNMQRQISRLNKICQIVIGTPGRLLDLIDRGHLDLGKFDSVVLDEVDRMMDMGFIDDVTNIVNMLPGHKHSMFFSATMEPRLKPICEKLLKDPITISVIQGKTSDYVDQDIVRVDRGENKFEKLVSILNGEEVDKVLIFCQRKMDVDDLEHQLDRAGFSVESLHGDKKQRTRDIAIKRFKQGEVKILIATDVAARGLDIPKVTHVINYDKPDNYDDYTHRIGRAGRAGNKGWALTFVN
jgi:ATP-dependent RNA helicase RhlE